MMDILVNAAGINYSVNLPILSYRRVAEGDGYQYSRHFLMLPAIGKEMIKNKDGVLLTFPQSEANTVCPLVMRLIVEQGRG